MKNVVRVRVAGLLVFAFLACGLFSGRPACAQSAESDAVPGARSSHGIEIGRAGQTVLLGGRRVSVRIMDTLPYVESECAKRYVFESYGDPKLERLRTEYGLDSVIATGRNEFERQLLLMDWVNRHIEYGDPLSLGKVRDPLAILELSSKEQKLYCENFAALLIAAAGSLGWVCRPMDIPTHSFTEMWSNQYRRWVMFDPTGHFYAEKDGVPLNTYEIRKEWFENRGKGVVFLRGRDRTKARGRGFGAYHVLYYVLKRQWLGQRPDDGAFVTRDKWSRGGRDYLGVLKDPAVDPYFPVNQAAIALVPDGENLKATLRTLTPNFKTFRVRIDGGAWTDTANTFTWKLHEGTNLLEAKSVNLFGVAGPVSTAELGVADASAAAAARIVIPAVSFTGQGGGKVTLRSREGGMPPGYVHLWHARGHWVEWTINSADAGEYDVTLTYSTRYQPQRELRVNGESVKGLEHFALGRTGSWRNYSRARLPARVTLKQGRNVLRMICLDETGVRLSEIRLSSPRTKDIVIEATGLTGEGGGKVERVFSPKGGYWRHWMKKDHWFEWTVENAEAGEYEVFLRYGSMYASPRELRVNGEVAPGLESFTMPLTGGWQEWVERPIPAKIRLKKGRNVLRMTSLGGNGVNMTAIRLAGAGKKDIFINVLDYTRQEGGKAVEYGTSRHGSFHGWTAKGHWLEWTIENASAGEYEVTLRHAGEVRASRELRINGQVAQGLESFAVEPTGGWQMWREAKLPARVRLGQGRNVIRMTSLGGDLNLDEIGLSAAKGPGVR
ncbi:MAG TPA: carbohydrate-binding protein [Phycisphaerae bacterium]|nr:carbohydrate-binding protein [Phycisphaerae bacterium]